MLQIATKIKKPYFSGVLKWTFFQLEIIIQNLRKVIFERLP